MYSVAEELPARAFPGADAAARTQPHGPAWYRTQLARAPISSDRAESPSGHLKLAPFHVIYRQYFRFVYLSARSLGVHAEAIDDVVQETFVIIHKRLYTLRNPDALRDWIYGIVRRSASSYRRAHRSRNREFTRYDVGGDGEADSPEPTPFERVERNSSLQVLALLLSQLEEPKREVFALVEIDELTVPEAADILQIPLNTAYSRLRSARQAFEAALARYEARNRGK